MNLTREQYFSLQESLRSTGFPFPPNVADFPTIGPLNLEKIISLVKDTDLKKILGEILIRSKGEKVTPPLHPIWRTFGHFPLNERLIVLENENGIDKVGGYCPATIVQIPFSMNSLILDNVKDAEPKPSWDGKGKRISLSSPLVMTKTEFVALQMHKEYRQLYFARPYRINRKIVDEKGLSLSGIKEDDSKDLSKSPRNTGESGFLCMMGVKIGDELIDTPLLERAKILNRLNKEIFIQLNSDLDTKYPPTRIDCDTPLWVSDQELRSIALLSDKKRAIAVKQLIKQITSGPDSQASKLVGKKKYHVSGHKRFLEVRLEWLIGQCKKAKT